MPRAWLCKAAPAACDLITECCCQTHSLAFRNRPPRRPPSSGSSAAAPPAPCSTRQGGVHCSSTRSGGMPCSRPNWDEGERMVHTRRATTWVAWQGQQLKVWDLRAQIHKHSCLVTAAPREMPAACSPVSPAAHPLYHKLNVRAEEPHRYISATCSADVASSAPLSSRTRTRRGKLHCS